MTQGGIGRFFHHGWEIAPGEDSLLARMASYHEFGHAALNSSTAWGGMLQHLDIAQGLTDDPAIAGVLNATVAASRHAHEVYATQVSISVFGSLAAGAERLLAAQPGYARFLTMAKKLGPGSADADRWADWDGLGEIRRAGVTACMQSPAVLRLLEDGTERFRLSAVPSRDWPDRRLRTLTRLAPDLWATRQPPADVDKRLHHAIDVAAEALRGAGHPTLSRDEYRAVLPELAAELNRLAAGTGQEIELNLDGDTGVPGLFGAEAVRVRAPLLAAVGELFDPADVDHLATDTVTGRHLYLCARRMHALRTQFALCPDPGLPDYAPVCAIVTPSGRAGRVDELRLTVLPRPEQIHRLDITDPIISCVSLDCLRDNAWRAAWLSPLRARTRVVGLLDLPVEPTILAWLDTREALRIGRLETTITGRPETALVFCLADEEPVLLPVTQASAHALLTYAERASKGAITLTDDESAQSNAHLVLDHILTEDAVRRPGSRSPRRPRPA